MVFAKTFFFYYIARFLYFLCIHKQKIVDGKKLFLELWNRLKINITHQKNIRSELATSNAKQTCNEKPSASCVCLICLYCGTYGIIPPTTIAVAAVQPTKWPIVRPSSSFIIQSIFVDEECVSPIKKIINLKTLLIHTTKLHYGLCGINTKTLNIVRWRKIYRHFIHFFL